MSKLEFLEVTRNFKSYYKTLRDVNYYLVSDFDKEELQTASQIITKLIFGFIRMNGTTFREMNPEQYEREFQMFHNDFLNIIQNSGENNVEFDDFAALLDELIGIADHRMNALGKIKKTKQEAVIQSDEIVDQVIEKEIELKPVVIIEDNVGKIVESNNESAVVEVISDVVEEITSEIDQVPVEMVEVSVDSAEVSGEVKREISGELNDVDADFEEMNESDDLYHFRPRRKRYR